eukprot:14054952-Ditylum_brightwellii.AAC.1
MEEKEIVSDNEEIVTFENEDKAKEDNNMQNLRRTTRTNVGQGVDRLFMDLKQKTYKNYRKKLTMMTYTPMKKHVLIQKVDDYRRNDDDCMSIVTKIIFSQMNAKKEIKMFGKHAVAALFKGYKQLNGEAVPGKPVISPIDPKTLTKKDRRQALETVNLIKEKWCRKIKGRACANDSRQQEFLKEDELVTPPTCALEYLLSMLIIDADERQDVGVYNISRAFLQSDIPNNKLLLMVIRGQFVDITCEVNSKFKQYMKILNRSKVLYIRVLQAIYGCIESALLWYSLYSTPLEKEGFVINPYN